MLLRALAASATAAIVALTLTGGYDGPPRWEGRTVTVSPDLAVAASAWGDVLDVRVTTLDPDISTRRVARVSGMGGAQANMTYRGGNYLAGCVIDLGPRVDPAMLTHEVGHCFGLGHEHRSTGTNMHFFAHDYQGGWSDTVTAYDLSILTTRYGK